MVFKCKYNIHLVGWGHLDETIKISQLNINQKQKQYSINIAIFDLRFHFNLILFFALLK